MITHHVAETTDRERLAYISRAIDRHPPERDGLFSGKLGTILYHFYHYGCSGSEPARAAGYAALDELLNRLPGGQSRLLAGTSLASGITGLAWGLQVLRNDRLLDFDVAEVLALADRRIAQVIPDQIEDSNLDFTHSAIGALAYCVERVDENPRMRPFLETCVERLHRKLQEPLPGQGYLQSLLFYKKFNYGGGREVNLGMAHGLCSILLIMIALHKQGIARAATRELVEKGIAFLLSLMERKHFEQLECSLFPSDVIMGLPRAHAENQSFYRQRLGWCYGDLNQALLLYAAGFTFNRPDWVALADEVGLFTLRKKDYTGTFIKDCYLCHGSAGAATFYHTLYQVSGRSWYHEGYTHWMGKTFEWLDQMSRNPEAPEKNISFLEGLAGTGLVILAHAQGGTPQWKKLLLLG